jgi:hypothetical protein
MPKLVKYGKWELENMERTLEAFLKGSVGLNAMSRAHPLRKLPENYFAVENIQVISEGVLVNNFYGWIFV